MPAYRRVFRLRRVVAMQILVLYFSQSGNTRKLAEAIAAGVKQVPDAVPMVKATEEVTKEDFTSSAGIIAGSPVYFGTMAAQLKEVFDKFVGVRKKMENKVGAAFATSGDNSGGKETTMISILQALLIYGMIVVGDPLSATGHYGVSCIGTPDEKTAEIGRKLGQRVAQLARKLQT
jgi:NAD(P)H dehydrogenase (quinone)